MSIATQPTPLTAEILQLSVAERIALANAIWDSVDENQPIQLTEAQKRELDRRLDELENDPRPGKSWEQLKAELLSR
jgi:putative addiction module component (TIGR02574 family)